MYPDDSTTQFPSFNLVSDDPDSKCALTVGFRFFLDLVLTADGFLSTWLPYGVRMPRILALDILTYIVQDNSYIFYKVEAWECLIVSHYFPFLATSLTQYSSYPLFLATLRLARETIIHFHREYRTLTYGILAILKKFLESALLKPIENEFETMTLHRYGSTGARILQSAHSALAATVGEPENSGTARYVDSDSNDFYSSDSDSSSEDEDTQSQSRDLPNTPVSRVLRRIRKGKLPPYYYHLYAHNSIAADTRGIDHDNSIRTSEQAISKRGNYPGSDVEKKGAEGFSTGVLFSTEPDREFEIARAEKYISVLLERFNPPLLLPQIVLVIECLKSIFSNHQTFWSLLVFWGDAAIKPNGVSSHNTDKPHGLPSNETKSKPCSSNLTPDLHSVLETLTRLMELLLVRVPAYTSGHPLHRSYLQNDFAIPSESVSRLDTAAGTRLPSSSKQCEESADVSGKQQSLKSKDGTHYYSNTEPVGFSANKQTPISKGFKSRIFAPIAPSASILSSSRTKSAVDKASSKKEGQSRDTRGSKNKFSDVPESTSKSFHITADSLIEYCPRHETRPCKELESSERDTHISVSTAGGKQAAVGSIGHKLLCANTTRTSASASASTNVPSQSATVGRNRSNTSADQVPLGNLLGIQSMVTDATKFLSSAAYNVSSKLLHISGQSEPTPLRSASYDHLPVAASYLELHPSNTSTHSVSSNDQLRSFPFQYLVALSLASSHFAFMKPKNPTANVGYSRRRPEPAETVPYPSNFEPESIVFLVLDCLALYVNAMGSFASVTVGSMEPKMFGIGFSKPLEQTPPTGRTMHVTRGKYSLGESVSQASSSSIATNPAAFAKHFPLFVPQASLSQSSPQGNLFRQMICNVMKKYRDIINVSDQKTPCSEESLFFQATKILQGCLNKSYRSIASSFLVFAFSMHTILVKHPPLMVVESPMLDGSPASQSLQSLHNLRVQVELALAKSAISFSLSCYQSLTMSLAVIDSLHSSHTLIALACKYSLPGVAIDPEFQSILDEFLIGSEHAHAFDDFFLSNDVYFDEYEREKVAAMLQAGEGIDTQDDMARSGYGLKHTGTTMEASYQGIEYTPTPFLHTQQVLFMMLTNFTSHLGATLCNLWVPMTSILFRTATCLHANIQLGYYGTDALEVFGQSGRKDQPSSNITETSLLLPFIPPVDVSPVSSFHAAEDDEHLPFFGMLFDGVHSALSGTSEHNTDLPNLVLGARALIHGSSKGVGGNDTSCVTAQLGIGSCSFDLSPTFLGRRANYITSATPGVDDPYPPMSTLSKSKAMDAFAISFLSYLSKTMPTLAEDIADIQALSASQGSTNTANVGSSGYFPPTSARGEGSYVSAPRVQDDKYSLRSSFLYTEEPLERGKSFSEQYFNFPEHPSPPSFISVVRDTIRSFVSQTALLPPNALRMVLYATLRSIWDLPMPNPRELPQTNTSLVYRVEEAPLNIGTDVTLYLLGRFMEIAVCNLTRLHEYVDFYHFLAKASSKDNREIVRAFAFSLFLDFSRLYIGGSGLSQPALLIPKDLQSDSPSNELLETISRGQEHIVLYNFVSIPEALSVFYEFWHSPFANTRVNMTNSLSRLIEDVGVFLHLYTPPWLHTVDMQTLSEVMTTATERRLAGHSLPLCLPKSPSFGVTGWSIVLGLLHSIGKFILLISDSQIEQGTQKYVLPNFNSDTATSKSPSTDDNEFDEAKRYPLLSFNNAHQANENGYSSVQCPFDIHPLYLRTLPTQMFLSPLECEKQMYSACPVFLRTAYRVLQYICDDFLHALPPNAASLLIQVLSLFTHQNKDLNIALVCLNSIWRLSDSLTLEKQFLGVDTSSKLDGSQLAGSSGADQKQSNDVASTSSTSVNHSSNWGIDIHFSLTRAQYSSLFGQICTTLASLAYGDSTVMFPRSFAPLSNDVDSEKMNANEVPYKNHGVYATFSSALHYFLQYIPQFKVTMHEEAVAGATVAMESQKNRNGLLTDIVPFHPSLVVTVDQYSVLRVEVRNSATRILFQCISTQGIENMCDIFWKELFLHCIIPLIEHVTTASQASLANDTQIVGDYVGKKVDASNVLPDLFPSIQEKSKNYKEEQTVRVTVHHSRNSLGKLWLETRVLAYSSMVRCISQSFPRIIQFPWFSADIWPFILAILENSMTGKYLQYRAGRNEEDSADVRNGGSEGKDQEYLSEPLEIVQCALQCLEVLSLLVIIPGGPSRPSDSDSTSVSFDTVVKEGTLVRNTTDKGAFLARKFAGQRGTTEQIVLDTEQPGIGESPPLQNSSSLQVDEQVPSTDVSHKNISESFVSTSQSKGICLSSYYLQRQTVLNAMWNDIFTVLRIVCSTAILDLDTPSTIVSGVTDLFTSLLMASSENLSLAEAYSYCSIEKSRDSVPMKELDATVNRIGAVYAQTIPCPLYMFPSRFQACIQLLWTLFHLRSRIRWVDNILTDESQPSTKMLDECSESRAPRRAQTTEQKYSAAVTIAIASQTSEHPLPLTKILRQLDIQPRRAETISGCPNSSSNHSERSILRALQRISTAMHSFDQSISQLLENPNIDMPVPPEVHASTENTKFPTSSRHVKSFQPAKYTPINTNDNAGGASELNEDEKCFRFVESNMQISWREVFSLLTKASTFVESELFAPALIRNAVQLPVHQQIGTGAEGESTTTATTPDGIDSFQYTPNKTQKLILLDLFGPTVTDSILSTRTQAPKSSVHRMGASYGLDNPLVSVCVPPSSFAISSVEATLKCLELAVLRPLYSDTPSSQSVSTEQGSNTSRQSVKSPSIFFPKAFLDSLASFLPSLASAYIYVNRMYRECKYSYENIRLTDETQCNIGESKDQETISNGIPANAPWADRFTMAESQNLLKRSEYNPMSLLSNLQFTALLQNGLSDSSASSNVPASGDSMPTSTQLALQRPYVQHIYPVKIWGFGSGGTYGHRGDGQLEVIDERKSAQMIRQMDSYRQHLHQLLHKILDVYNKIQARNLVPESHKNGSSDEPSQEIDVLIQSFISLTQDPQYKHSSEPMLSQAMAGPVQHKEISGIPYFARRRMLLDPSSQFVYKKDAGGAGTAPTSGPEYCSHLLQELHASDNSHIVPGFPISLASLGTATTQRRTLVQSLLSLIPNPLSSRLPIASSNSLVTSGNSLTAPANGSRAQRQVTELELQNAVRNFYVYLSYLDIDVSSSFFASAPDSLESLRKFLSSLRFTTSAQPKSSASSFATLFVPLGTPQPRYNNASTDEIAKQEREIISSLSKSFWAAVNALESKCFIEAQEATNNVRSAVLSSYSKARNTSGGLNSQKEADRRQSILQRHRGSSSTGSIESATSSLSTLRGKPMALGTVSSQFSGFSNQMDIGKGSGSHTQLALPPAAAQLGPTESPSIATGGISQEITVLHVHPKEGFYASTIKSYVSKQLDELTQGVNTQSLDSHTFATCKNESSQTARSRNNSIHSTSPLNALGTDDDLGKKPSGKGRFSFPSHKSRMPSLLPPFLPLFSLLHAPIEAFPPALLPLYLASPALPFALDHIGWPTIPLPDAQRAPNSSTADTVDTSHAMNDIPLLKETKACLHTTCPSDSSTIELSMLETLSLELRRALLSTSERELSSNGPNADNLSAFQQRCYPLLDTIFSFTDSSLLFLYSNPWMIPNSIEQIYENRSTSSLPISQLMPHHVQPQYSQQAVVSPVLLLPTNTSALSAYRMSHRSMQIVARRSFAILAQWAGIPGFAPHVSGIGLSSPVEFRHSAMLQSIANLARKLLLFHCIQFLDHLRSSLQVVLQQRSRENLNSASQTNSLQQLYASLNRLPKQAPLPTVLLLDALVVLQTILHLIDLFKEVGPSQPMAQKMYQEVESTSTTRLDCKDFFQLTSSVKTDDSGTFEEEFHPAKVNIQKGNKPNASFTEETATSSMSSLFKKCMDIALDILQLHPHHLINSFAIAICARLRTRNDSI